MPTIISGTNGIDQVTDNTIVVADLKAGQTVGVQKMRLFAAQNTTSGTSVDFTGIPSWAKKITVMLNGVSTAGGSAVQIQMGTSSGIDATGYAGSYGGAVAGTHNTGFVTTSGNAAADARHGALCFSQISGNTWSAYGSISLSNTTQTSATSGTKALSGTLDRIRLTTVGGTDTFDAGSVSILVEGYE